MECFYIAPEGEVEHSSQHLLHFRKYWTAIAPSPNSVTTVLITLTAHSRVERGGVISITTMVASKAPPAVLIGNH